jgi:hypothetical protein
MQSCRSKIFHIFRALTKEIDIGLSIQRIEDDVLEELLIQGGAVSPIVTIEPRRRKFHKPITVTMPLPEKVAHYNGRPSTFGGGGGGQRDGGGDSSAGASRKTSFDSGHKLLLGKIIIIHFQQSGGIYTHPKLFFPNEATRGGTSLGTRDS